MLIAPILYEAEKKLWNEIWLTIRANDLQLQNAGKQRWRFCTQFFLMHGNGVLAQFPNKKARMFCNIGVNIHKILSYIQKYNKIRRPRSEMRGIKLSLIHVCKTAPVNTGKCKHMAIYKCLKIEPSLIFMVWGMVGYDATPLQRSTVG